MKACSLSETALRLELRTPGCSSAETSHPQVCIYGLRAFRAWGFRCIFGHFDSGSLESPNPNPLNPRALNKDPNPPLNPKTLNPRAPKTRTQHPTTQGAPGALTPGEAGALQLLSHLLGIFVVVVASQVQDLGFRVKACLGFS